VKKTKTTVRNKTMNLQTSAEVKANGGRVGAGHQQNHRGTIGSGHGIVAADTSTLKPYA
jgi:hypothetical protein